MANSVVVGMGFGGLYKKILESMGHTVVTVDPHRPADYTSIEEIPDLDYLTAHICTPNYTHYRLARQVAHRAKIVFVEKPGFQTPSHWSSIQDEFPSTRFMMTKNNQYRDNIEELKQLAQQTRITHLHWVNSDRVPSPGSWFTNKDLSYGGVSRDLVPHLLSLICVLDPNYQQIRWRDPVVFQNWRLEDLSSTDYGTITQNGVYNVDDRYECTGNTNNLRQYHVRADWRSMTHTDIGIHFGPEFVELGLCPESAYQRMIETAIQNINNNAFWLEQRNQDLWIQKQIQI